MRLRAPLFVIAALVYSSAFGHTVQPTTFERELFAANYGLGMDHQYAALDDNAAGEFTQTTSDIEAKKKSPGKAFVYSLVVPGAGQFYNGRKIKAAAFLGIEAASWILYAGFRSDGNDLTDKFEKFNDMYWSETRYSDYLASAYEGQRDDDSIQKQEISHHLPDTKTQQYYEMTGKYDQFSWGWDDATLDGQTLDDYIAGSGVPIAVGSDVPQSSHRQQYEGMRHDANSKFDKATKMIIVASINHVVSAFEAMISANRHNSRLESGGGDVLGQVQVKASLRSYNSFRDTPYLNLSYKF